MSFDGLPKALAENLKRRASLISDSKTITSKEDQEDEKKLRIDYLEKEIASEVLCNPAVEATPQKGSYQSLLERCLS